MTKLKDVKEFEYPTKVTLTEAIKGLLKISIIDTLFHSLMAILLISGLMIDLLGTFLGGWLFQIRIFAHGYIGAILAIVFPIYLIKVISTRKIRMLMTIVNYIDFVFYGILVLSGIALASINQPWITILPWLPQALGVIRRFSPAIHTTTTYVWLLVSTLLPGGFLHGIATGYLILIQKERKGRRRGN